jgi:elongation factor G
MPHNDGWNSSTSASQDNADRSPPSLRRVGVASPARGEYRYVRQQGGSQYGHIVLTVEPISRDSIEIAWEVPAETVPAEFANTVIEAIQEHAREALPDCLLVRTLVRVVDGSFHFIDSRAVSYRVAATHAFEQAIEKAGLIDYSSTRDTG